MIRSINTRLAILFVCLPLVGCMGSRSDSTFQSPPQMITAEGSSHPDEAISIQQKDDNRHELLDDVVFQSYKNKDLAIEFGYKRITLPAMPELEEVQTISAARLQGNQYMAQEVYSIALERRRKLGPIIEKTPKLIPQIEEAIRTMGIFNVSWDADRTRLDAAFTLPGKAIVDVVNKYLEEHYKPENEVSYTEESLKQRQILAREKAIENARQELRNKIMNHPYKSNQTLGELVERNPRMRMRVEDFIRTSPLKSVTEDPDGTIIVTIEVDINRLIDVLR